MIKSFNDLEVNKLSYTLVMEIFQTSRNFPKEETQNRISLAKDCGYLTEKEYLNFQEKPDHVGKMLTKLHQNWETKKDYYTRNFEHRVSNI